MPRLVVRSGAVLRMRTRPKIIGFLVPAGNSVAKIRSLFIILLPFDETSPATFCQSEENDSDLLKIFCKNKLTVEEKITGLPTAIQATLGKEFELLNSVPKAAFSVSKPTSVKQKRELKDAENSAAFETVETEEALRLTEINKSQFIAEQRMVLDTVDAYLNALFLYQKRRQERYSDNTLPKVAVPKPLTIFVQGPAGTGKLFLISKIWHLVQNYTVPEKKIVKVARYKGGV